MQTVSGNIYLSMKYPLIFFPLYFIINGCNNSSIKPSAKKLNDSAIAITNQYQDTAKFEQAIALLNEAIAQDSSIFDLFKNKYFFEVTLGDYKSAMNTNRRLLSFKPDSADLHFQAATFEQFYQDTIQSNISFGKASLLYKASLDTMSINSPYRFYYWRLWAYSMIMIGQESLIHKFLKENCTTSFDSLIYQPEMLSKNKKELQEAITEKLTERKYSR